MAVGLIWRTNPAATIKLRAPDSPVSQCVVFDSASVSRLTSFNSAGPVPSFIGGRDRDDL